MALGEETRVDYVGINRQGDLEVRKVRRINDNGDTLAERYARIVLQPGDDLSDQRIVEFFAGVPSADKTRLRAIADLIWTPAVIAARRARDAAANAQPLVPVP